MTKETGTIDTSAGRVHKNPIAELMREAADKLDQSGLPCQGLVEDLLDAADDIERQEPVATLYSKGPGPIEVRFTESTEFGTKLPHGTRLFAAPVPAIPEETLSPYEILGWCHAYFCCSLDAGEDPRTTEVGDIIEKMNRQLLAAAPQPAEQQPVTVVTDEMVEAVQRICETAMRQSVVARIPECGEFSGIAQDAGWLLNALREARHDPS